MNSLCGHCGFAGGTICILDPGHEGNHKYGDPPTVQESMQKRITNQEQRIRDLEQRLAKIALLWRSTSIRCMDRLATDELEACLHGVVEEKPTPNPKERIVIVYDGHKWFVRSILTSTHDFNTGHMVYECDEPIANDLDDFEAVARIVSFRRNG